MRRRVFDEKPVSRETGPAVVIPHDISNEAAVIAFAAQLPLDQLRALVRRVRPDHFVARDHQEAWQTISECARQGLSCTSDAMEKIGGIATSAYIDELVDSRAPGVHNLEWHLDHLFWDAARAGAARGSVPSFLEALRDPKADPEKVRSLARSVAASFDGYQDRRHLFDPARLVREQMVDVEARASGRAVFNYGIEGLDYFESRGEGLRKRRMLPGAAPGQVTVITGCSGSGKALALDTPIPTPRGWTTMGELKFWDEVFDENGERCRVIGYSDIMVGNDCYEVVFSDGSTIVADGDHLWKTVTRRERVLLMHRTKIAREKRRILRGAKRRRKKVSRSLLAWHADRREVIDEKGTVRTTRQIAGSLFDGEGRNHSVGVCGPLALPRAKLPIDPYLMGVWLGDGTSATGSITCADIPIIHEIEAIGYEVRKPKAKYRWTVVGLHTQLNELGLLNAKRVPPEYLRASTPQRLALLQGLMDTDGTCSKEGACNFDTTNESLMHAVRELLSSLGIKSSVLIKDAKLYGRVVGLSWRVMFTTGMPIFRLPRKLARLRPVGRDTRHRRYIVAVNPVPSVPVRCIRVSSNTSMFLAGRQMIPTHNSTTTIHLALGLAGWDWETNSFSRDRRKVLYGAWEMAGGVTLELCACVSLGWSRSELMEGKNLGHERRVLLEERMHEIAKVIRFMGNPFRRSTGERPSNDRNLDIIQGYIADSGCDVFIADLWKRCLRDTSPDAEEDALVRQQSMAEEMRVHAVLLQQQRLKDIEMREDKRPTREGIKGSGAWVEIADTIIGIHRPALWKRISDTKLEMCVLKQRYGQWPLAVEFDWDADRGMISGGRGIEYDRPGERSEFDEGILRGVPGGRGGNGFKRRRAD